VDSALPVFATNDCVTVCVRFLHHNQRQGGLTGVVLDHAGDITDTGIMRLAEHSAPKLSQLSLARCPHVTNAALRSVCPSVCLSVPFCLVLLLCYSVTISLCDQACLT